MFISIQGHIVNTALITEIVSYTETSDDQETHGDETSFSFTIYFCAMSDEGYLTSKFSFYKDKSIRKGKKELNIEEGRKVYQKLVEVLKPLVIG